MNCEAAEMMPMAASMVTESPQPLPLTTSNSSRCTSPMSPPSDQNGSSSNEDESVSGINLTMNKSKQQQSQQQQQHVPVTKRPSPHLNHDIMDYRLGHKIKMSNMSNDFSNIAAYSKASKLYRYQAATAAAIDSYNNNIAGITSPELIQILLEYRYVLLDILTKSMLLNDNYDEEQDNLLHRAVVLPNKCKCGYTSELSNQIIRSSTYVHQLELKYRALVETSKVPAEPNRYTPKRPTFINAQYPGGNSRSSLLEKKKKSRMHSMDKPQISIFSGNSSINSSLNDEEEDIDSDDVNEENIVANLNAPIYMNGSLDESGNNGGKTILEGYLESMKNPPSDEGSEEDGKEEEEADDCHVPFAEKDDLPKVGPGKRIDIKTKNLVIQMQMNGASFTDISRHFGISRKSVRRIISNYKTFGSLEKKRDSPKGSTNGLNAVAVNGVNGLVMTDSYPDTVDDDLGDEREMIMDESVMGDEDDPDLDDDDDNVPQDVSLKNEMEPNIINSFTLFPRVPQQQQQQHSSHVNSHHSLHHNSYHHQMNKSKRNLSLIQGPYNGGTGAYSQNIKHSQYQSNNHNNHNGIANNRLSLIKPVDRYKPYDMKIRNNSNNNEFNSQLSHRMSKSHPIVPPLPMSTNMYQPRAHVKMFNNSSNNDHNNNNRNHFSNNNNDREIRNKNKNRHSIDMSFKESMIIPEADKNNNTQLSNCNVTITSTSSGKSNNNDAASNLPPIPASLADGNSDSEANLVPKTFMDGFPTGIMNSLNPNRATKLTLEDFNVVWQLRSQHWTHNQIRKYFQQRGKSISKSSISRIMNGKQRNFQQFFTVVPSGSNF